MTGAPPVFAIRTWIRPPAASSSRLRYASADSGIAGSSPASRPPAQPDRTPQQVAATQASATNAREDVRIGRPR
ncbi:hypothetical protein [Rhodococcus koreensis]|uniref:hypothetical protein n=1 Tax=Rhodococcus koreensis TaxID=99653 RepID=UPI001981B4D5|nr:hypothetical protein [Rhodococcus koreensis]QSE85541.1 hypothetical protein JWS14_06315 [Rhodococcus koreensis]